MMRARTSKLLAGLVLSALLVTGACGGDDDDDEASEGQTDSIEGVETFELPPWKHVETEVKYSQTPPVGGDHHNVWINCGYYAKELPSEMAVHSMEHGAVWVTHDPALDQAQVDKLKELAENGTYLLVSPYPGLPSKVVASAWGVQLQLDSADDPRLAQFLDQYREGDQTPEPGAPCSGGLSPQ